VPFYEQGQREGHGQGFRLAALAALPSNKRGSFKIKNPSQICRPNLLGKFLLNAQPSQAADLEKIFEATD
jgi:hypothetical protein